MTPPREELRAGVARAKAKKQQGNGRKVRVAEQEYTSYRYDLFERQRRRYGS